MPLVELRGSAVIPWGGGEGSADTEPRLQRDRGNLSPDGTAGSGASGEHPGPARGTSEREETPGSGRFGKEQSRVGTCGAARSSLRAQRREGGRGLGGGKDGRKDQEFYL